MGIDWQRLLTTVFLGTGAGAVVAWLVKALFKEWLARDTETFKAQLSLKTSMEVEELKNSLQKTAIENQIRFSKLHEKRAEVIEGLYVKLTEILSRAEHFAVTSENNPRPEHKEQYAALWKELNEYLSSIQRNRIFLPAEVCELLFEHLKQIRRTVHVAGSHGGKEFFPTPELAEQSAEAFTRVYEAFNTEIPAAQKLLEAEFRKMLGVE